MNKLIIVGCGIKFLSHITLEVQSAIQKSDCVVYLVNDPAMKQWITTNNPNTLSLDSIYFSYKDRSQAYHSITREIIKIAKENRNTCFVNYGHPLLMSSTSSQIIKTVEEDGLDIQVEILPGISSLDCLLCDLRIDPGIGGIQAYESTAFINKEYKINPDSHLVLWQIGVIGIKTIITDEKELTGHPDRKDALHVIQEKLLTWYAKDHLIIFYTASRYPSISFDTVTIRMSQLDSSSPHRLSTAYIPPT